MCYTLGKIVAYDVATMDELAVMDRHTDCMYSMAISADGNLVASGAQDRKCIVWNAHTCL